MADVVVLTGPTASGKSAIALEAAMRTGAEIVSMDSRQVYRGMDVGTAKPTAGERAAIPHHGLDLVDPDERYSAGRFARDARAWLAGIRARSRRAIVVGGTGFFLRALTHPLFREPELPADRRVALQAYLDTLSPERVRAWAALLEGTDDLPPDRQRLGRLIEVATLTGRSLGWWHRHAAPTEPPLDAPIVVLEPERAGLYARIDARVPAMVEAGFVEEVRALRDAGYGAGDPGLKAPGYPEMLAVVVGTSTLADAIERTQARTRAYARRQTTWFRHQLPDAAIRTDEEPAAVVDRVVGILEEDA